MNNDDGKYPTMLFGPIKATVMPEADILAEKDGTIFVALPKHKFDQCPSAFVDGTVGGYFCRVCNQECVLAPSGQSMESQGMQVTCMDCALQAMEAERDGHS